MKYLIIKLLLWLGFFIMLAYGWTYYIAELKAYLKGL